MKTSDVAMSVDEALTHADEWAAGQTFYAGAQGWLVVCAVLAAEVRRLRADVMEAKGEIEFLDRENDRLRESARINLIFDENRVKQISSLNVSGIDTYAQAYHRAIVDVLQILRGE